MDPIEETPVPELNEPTLPTTTPTHSTGQDLAFVAITMIAGYATGKAIEKITVSIRKALKKRKDEPPNTITKIAK